MGRIDIVGAYKGLIVVVDRDDTATQGYSSCYASSVELSGTWSPQPCSLARDMDSCRPNVAQPQLKSYSVTATGGSINNAVYV